MLVTPNSGSQRWLCSFLQRPARVDQVGQGHRTIWSIFKIKPYAQAQDHLSSFFKTHRKKWFLQTVQVSVGGAQTSRHKWWRNLNLGGTCLKEDVSLNWCGADASCLRVSQQSSLGKLHKYPRKPKTMCPPCDDKECLEAFHRTFIVLYWWKTSSTVGGLYGNKHQLADLEKNQDNSEISQIIHQQKLCWLSTFISQNEYFLLNEYMREKSTCRAKEIYSWFQIWWMCLCILD